RACRKRSMSIEISSGGRRQFSLENANNVRNSTSRSMHARMIARTASTPRRCPATRGSIRFFAQRPLPSMMIATWRGTSDVAGMSRVELGNMGWREPVAMSGCRRRLRRGRPSDGNQIGCVGGEHLVDVGEIAVGELLDIGLRVPLVVLCHRVVLQQFLQVVV